MQMSSRLAQASYLAAFQALTLGDHEHIYIYFTSHDGSEKCGCRLAVDAAMMCTLAPSRANC